MKKRSMLAIASLATALEVAERLVAAGRRLPEVIEAVRAMNPDLTLVGEPVLYAWADDPFTLGTPIPTLALTAYAREEDRARCLAAGFDAYGVVYGIYNAAWAVGLMAAPALGGCYVSCFTARRG